MTFLKKVFILELAQMITMAETGFDSLISVSKTRECK